MCGVWFPDGTRGSGPAAAGRPHAAYRGHGWWGRGARSSLSVEQEVCVAAPGSPGLLGPVPSSLPVSPAHSAVVVSHAASVAGAWPSSGFSGAPGLPEARHSTARIPMCPARTPSQAAQPSAVRGPALPFCTPLGTAQERPVKEGLWVSGPQPSWQTSAWTHKVQTGPRLPPCLPHLRVSVPAPPAPVGGLLPTSALVGAVGTSPLSPPSAPLSPPSAPGRRWPPVGAARGLDVDALS